MVRYAMSRWRRNLVAVAAALLVMAVVALDHSCVKPVVVPTTAKQESLDFQKYYGKQFTVVKVVDGDTLDIGIPDGNYSHTRIRLWGVDTPETKDPRLNGPMYYGPEAAEFVTTKTLSKKVVVYLEEDKNTRDKYHRLLAYVQLPDGKFLNEELLKEGYAYADTRFKHGLYNKYKQLEALAKKQKKGLWEKVSPEQMPKWKQKQELTAEHAETAEVIN